MTDASEPQRTLGEAQIIAAPWITHERLDDEVMAINLETGAYFALDDIAADAWMLVIAGRSLDEMADVIASRYEVGAELARADLERFITELETERLVVRAEASESSASNESHDLPEIGARRPYVAPVVNKYDDLEELLRLDPVHDVDEVGWPVPRHD